MTTKFNITGMTCSACSSHIEKSVNKLDGVKNASVNLLANTMNVDYDDAVLSSQIIIEAVEKAGYGASPQQLKTDGKQITVSPNQSIHKDIKQMKFRLIISLVFMIPLFYISMGHMMGAPLPTFLSGHENSLSFAFTQFLLSLPIIYVNFKYFKNGFKSLFKGSPNMDSLIAIGCTAAMLYGIYAIYKIGYGFGHGDMAMVHKFSMDLYFESAAMILALITLGKFLEARAKGKTSDAITKLINLTPKTAIVLRDGNELEIATNEIIAGDIVVIKPGGIVPVDGVITDGNSSIDESALTGESIPVEKQVGDKATGGSVNKSGYFKMRAMKVGEDTTLSQIIRLVEEAGSSKAPIAKLADKVSRIFVPMVIAIAVLAVIVWLLLGYSFEFAFSIGIAVLVISCPCALGLATPTAIMVGTGKGAQNGILIKSAESLEILHKINTVVLDKTGTITNGKPEVTNVLCFAKTDENELIRLGASLEKKSEHPLAEAIVAKATHENVSLYEVSEFDSITGKGITGVINGIKYFAGNLKLMSDNSIDTESYNQTADKLANDGKTPLFFANQTEIIGIIAVMDTVKATSKQAINQLKAMGIETVMLTGDNKRTAQAIKEQVGVQTVIAEVMPADKEQHVRSIMESGRHVAMIGDGINDSPALARANVGIAIGAGTDIAIESADVVLMKSDLLDAVTAIQLSKATIVNIKQNLFWALFYNCLGIPLAAGVFYGIFGWLLNPMFAAAAMSLSSIFVVANALRLKMFRPKFKMISEHSNQAENISINGNSKSHEIKDNKNINIEKGEIVMNKKMIVNGMTCGHCKGRVEGALNAIDGVTATVNLDEKSAVITLSKEVSDEALISAVTEAGYEVEGLTNA